MGCNTRKLDFFLCYTTASDLGKTSKSHKLVVKLCLSPKLWLLNPTAQLLPTLEAYAQTEQLSLKTWAITMELGSAQNAIEDTWGFLTDPKEIIYFFQCFIRLEPPSCEKVPHSLKTLKYNIPTEMASTLSIIPIKWPEKFLWTIGRHVFTSQ